MADHSKIEWTDATWNPVTGCSIVSPGCTHCYAMKLAGTRLAHHPSRAGLTRETKAGPVWNGTVRFNEDWLTQPLGWKRPRMVFVCAHGDLFHEDVPDAWIDRVFAVMALAPHHTFQVLTKRAVRMRRYMSDAATPGRITRALLDMLIAGLLPAASAASDNWPVESVGEDIDEPDDVTLRSWPLPNIWLGVSTEDQARAGERVPDLLATPAAIRFVSAEPLLGPIDFTYLNADSILTLDALTGLHADCDGAVDGVIDSPDPALDWIIVGGENGPRPMQAVWAQSIRDQCAAAGTFFFFKQWGSHIPAGQTMANGKVWAPGCGTRLRATKAITGRLLDGIEHSGMPRAAA